MEQKPKKRRFLKRALIAGSILILIFLALQYWFINNARNVLKNYISEQSKGKITLELERLNLNLLTKRLQIVQGELKSTDSTIAPVSYQVNFTRLSVNVGSMWSLLFRKELMLDSLKIYNPNIRVTQWRKDTSRLQEIDKLSIPQELGKVYNALLGALNEFAVRRIIIDNAQVNLVNKIDPKSEPVNISNIHFDLARKYTLENNRYVFTPGEQTIELRTFNQDIALPDERHRLAFKSFRLQLIGQTIEMDSCTVTARSTDSVKSNYSIFYKKLYLSGVDFPALSAQNLIKADTVYCVNPVFDFNIYRGETTAQNNTPDPRKIIGELSGNLDLGYVKIEQAGINFNLYGKTDRSFFNANKDDFTIRGLRINPDSAYPVSLRDIDMVLKEYQLYNQDSSSSFSFDSLRLKNNDIILNNFAVSSNSGRRIVRNDIDVKVPYFELSNLDWYELIFNEYLIARTALLKDPVVNFTRKKTGVAGRKFKLFDALLSLDNQAGLENVTVLNGTMNMRLGPTSAFNVANIDFRVNSNKVLSSTTKENLRSAVEYLSFKKGELRLKDLSARMQNARFTNDNIIFADLVSITGKDEVIKATVHNVFIDNMQMDDNADSIDVDGFRWKNADVTLQALPAVNDDDNGISSIYLKNISGEDTRLKFSNRQTTVSTFLNSLTATSILRKEDGLIIVEDFSVDGSDLIIDGKEVQVNANAYRLTGKDSSIVNNVQVTRITGDDTMNIRTPAVQFSTDLNRLFANDLHFDYLHAKDPVIKMARNDRNGSGSRGQSATVNSPIRIDELTAHGADITLSTNRDDSATVLRIPSTENSQLSASGIVITGPVLEIASLKMNTNSATFVNRAGALSGVEKGKIDMDLSSIRFGRHAGKMNWSGIINTLNIENANGITLKQSKSNLYFQQASLGNISLASDYLPNFSEILKINVSAWLRIPEGQYIDSATTIRWYNAHFSSNQSVLTLDSMQYHPTLPLDSVLARANYEADYITLRTGAITIDGLDAERFEENSSVIAQKIDISNPIVTVFRDKQLPSPPLLGKKPLPVELINSLSLPVQVQELNFHGGHIGYTEKNAKTGNAGTLQLHDVHGQVRNLQNVASAAGDSLYIDFNTQIMNAAPATINVAQSYSDSLGSFVLKASIGKTAIAVLNPFLQPVVNVRIRSGELDSGKFIIHADKIAATGTMDLDYRDLKIRILKNGDPEKTPFLQNAISFFANTFLIRNNSRGRTGLIFYELQPEQSFIKYTIKSFISGVASNVGARNNKKHIRRYERKKR